jgi:hypothetical protein
MLKVATLQEKYLQKTSRSSQCSALQLANKAKQRLSAIISLEDAVLSNYLSEDE